MTYNELLKEFVNIYIEDNLMIIVNFINLLIFLVELDKLINLKNK